MESINRCIVPVAVTYRDVDRSEALLLPTLFHFLQEAAVVHANRFGLGTTIIAERGESWVLNRMAAAVHRYPRFGEHLQITTWSRGIKGFKGYREFQLRGPDGELLVSASSLWVYVNVRTKSIVRVPREIAETFPICADSALYPDLESIEFARPEPPGSATHPVTVRYSDLDANGHVNHTAYIDYVQTALIRAGRSPQPGRIKIKFGKEIPADVEVVEVRSSGSEAGVVFSIERDGAVFAQGEVA